MPSQIERLPTVAANENTDRRPSQTAGPMIEQMNYRSYLLRLRQCSGSDGEQRQVCMRCIRDDEEHYFNSLRELMAYLRRCNGECE